MTPLFVVHKPSRPVELYQSAGKNKVVALALANGHVVADLKPFASCHGRDAEGAIEALAAVLQRKTSRNHRNEARGAKPPPL
jgi:hypothetical protein